MMFSDVFLLIIYAIRTIFVYKKSFLPEMVMFYSYMNIFINIFFTHTRCEKRYTKQTNKYVGTLGRQVVNINGTMVRMRVLTRVILTDERR